MSLVARLTSTPTKAFLLLGCLAAGLATQADASEVYIQPTITGYSMYWGTPSGDYGYYKGLGNLVYGMFYSDYYAWIKHGFLEVRAQFTPGHLCHLVRRTVVLPNSSFGGRSIGYQAHPRPGVSFLS